MIKILKDLRGITPVIATLMLTLIAVTAASSFALFVSQKQEDIQKAEQSEYLSNLEKLEIMGINDFRGDSNISRRYINISVSSLHTRDSEVYFFINGQVATNKSSPTFNISSFENINCNLTEGVKIKNNSPITVKIVTSRWLNNFERTFYPPIAMINIETHSELIGGIPKDYYILDGSSSYCLEDGIYIVNYTWNYNSTEYGYGQKIRVNELSDNVVYLTVRDNMGMTASSKAVFN